MANNELLIKINADAKNAENAFNDMRQQTSDLEGQLNTAAVVSGIAFAAFTATIVSSVHAFEEANKESVKLTNALQNQGIYTEQLAEDYDNLALKIQRKTGFDDDAVKSSLAVAQSFLGQRVINEELASSIADLGEKMGGDLNGAAEKIARTIGTGTNAFAKQGLVLSETATEAERYSKVLEFVQNKYGGLAAEANRADGYTRALSNSFGNFQEAIGQRFAPVFSAVRKVLVDFFDAMSSKDSVIPDLVAAFLAAGAAVSGIIAFASAAIPAFLALKAAVIAVGLSFNVAFVGIPLLIGALVAGITLLALNWDKSMAAIKAASVGAVTLISELFGGLGKVLSGAFSLDPTKIKAGLSQITEAFKKSKDETVKTYQEITAAQQEEQIKQDAGKKAAADREAAEKRRHQNLLVEIEKNSLQLLRLQNENASQAQIDLKTKEIEVLKALNEQKSKDEIALLTEKLATIRSLQEQQIAEDLARQRDFLVIQQQMKDELSGQGIEVEASIREKRLAEIQSSLKTEQDIDRQVQEDILKKRIEGRNQELLDRKKYGEAYAAINKAFNSEEVQGAKSASSELVQLQQSKNETLKSIGKAAAISQIVISTQESAMKIYQGFSSIPIVGPALGIAGAAAAIAYGAERVGQVTAAADGGLITGGIQGRDSVPALLEPGELVVPKRNFNDVVGAVQGDNSVGNAEMLNVLNEINAKFSNPQTTILQGDVMADDSFVDGLVRRISDAIEFRNAKLFGVNT